MRIPPIAGALVASLLSLLLLAPPPVAAQPTAAAESGRVRGEVLTPGSGSPKLKVTVFTTDYRVVTSKPVRGGGYSLTLPVGTYVLQFTDQRPAYDTRKLQPTDLRVSVVAGTTVGKSVRMKRGAAIGGRVKAGKKRAGKARIVAALADGRSFESTADAKGNYALGGLPAGKYSVFTYDRKHEFVDKSRYLRKVKVGKYKKVNIALKRRAGNLLVDLYAGSSLYKPRVFATAVSVKTGQFWTVGSRGGTFTFQGLYPGRYRVQITQAVGDYLPDTQLISGSSATVKSGRTGFGSMRLTRMGATVTGKVVDANRPAVALANARVRLYSSAGSVIGETVSNDQGVYRFGGGLTTADGLTVVAGPRADSLYLGQNDSYCKYADTTSAPFGITTGTPTSRPDLGIAHLPNERQDAGRTVCHTPAPTNPTSTSGAAGR